MYKIAVLGERESVMGFAALGLAVFPVESAEEAAEAFHRLTRQSDAYAIIYVTETYAAALAPGYRFHSIQNVKFAAPLLPENTVTLLLAWQPERQMLTFSYQRHAGNERHTASSGKIRLCQ